MTLTIAVKAHYSPAEARGCPKVSQGTCGISYRAT
jgi:hypothetical protein